MSTVEHIFETEDLHPIDIVETLAEHNAWDFDRVSDEQIAMVIEGSWRSYSVSLAWSAHDEVLRLICTLKMMVFRYGLNLAGGAVASADQITDMMQNAVVACERYYPAFQLVCWGDSTPQDAMGIAIAEAYGRA